MELNIKENTKTKLVFSVSGGTATLLNSVRQAVSQDEKVKIAGFNIPHPLVGESHLQLETTTQKKPVTALQEAIKAVKSDVTKLKRSVKK